jgi:anti-sigma B factor antagonist
VSLSPIHAIPKFVPSFNRTSFKFTEISRLCNQGCFLSVYGEAMETANSASAPHPQVRGQAGAGKSLTFSLEAQQPGGAIVLRCQGRLFPNDVSTLSALVAEALPTARRMIVDLSGVESIDSAGLGELVLTHMWAEAAGFELKFAGPRTAVLELFELTNLVSIFDIYPGVPEAMAAMSPGRNAAGLRSC